ncbi:MAG: D-aminoacyl-tRNA deacylase [Bacteroidota bacterium]
MRALIQRVSEAEVTIEGQVNGKIGLGLMILLGVENDDAEEDIKWLAAKISKLRVFDDENGVMNLSVLDVGGDVMVVSQFTLHASVKKGNRPSYIRAARPEISEPMYQKFVKEMEQVTGKPAATGDFGANMKISLTNDGPVTIWIDSKNKE